MGNARNLDMGRRNGAKIFLIWATFTKCNFTLALIDGLEKQRCLSIAEFFSKEFCKSTQEN
jgi:hypothetical protein